MARRKQIRHLGEGVSRRSGSDTCFAWLYYQLVDWMVVKGYPKGGFDLMLMDKVMLPFMANSAKNTNPTVYSYWLGFPPKALYYRRRERRTRAVPLYLQEKAEVPVRYVHRFLGQADPDALRVRSHRRPHELPLWSEPRHRGVEGRCGNQGIYHTRRAYLVLLGAYPHHARSTGGISLAGVRRGQQQAGERDRRDVPVARDQASSLRARRAERTAYSERASAEERDEWDAFVAASKNGTFLFLRDYMDYHADRFADHSLIVRDRSGIVALLPANRRATRSTATTA